MKITKCLLFIILFSTITFAQNGEKNFIDQPYIEVTGQVETEIIPNEIYLNIILNENDKKGKVSIEKQENQMISTLKSLSIDLEKNFSILDFNGYYKRKFLADDKVTKTKRYQLIINDGETLGKVYQALDRIDVSNISIIKTSHSDIEKIRRDTKLKALKVAKEKANAYAEVINQNIGKALFIKEQSFGALNGMIGNANGISIRGLNSNYLAESKFNKIQDLNLKTITVSETVLVKFILN
ncbi:SIMPL domain-containing protein [Flavivirga rizhaonensis]|uniref:SIMPL domain-containing protein n=1 Tax=Flavivirga rizhaonensis TaxID=2559571 RepID=A0A4S1DSF6_9FLAO|nr:SIMPL domain-containing protein [Flavivirga rizhaonensis]TGV00877.1 SIMPL domain-containing protein [Flavivirga rizhaonensis]